MVLIHEGLRVPWVTRWSNDVVRQPYGVHRYEDGTYAVGYADPREDDWDRYGVLWMRENNDPTGEPQFSQVSTFRQRQSMVDGICQVCGNVIQDDPIHWLMTENQLEHYGDTEPGLLPDLGAVTFSPPTCAKCVEISLRLCPALGRNKRVLVKVSKYTLIGVMGETVRFDAAGNLQRERFEFVGYGSGDEHTVVAKQMVARFDDFTVEEI